MSDNKILSSVPRQNAWSPSPLLRPSSAGTVVTTTDSLWLQLVRPLRGLRKPPARSKVNILTSFDLKQVEKILGREPSVLAVDLETKGLFPKEDGNDIVGIGMASATGIVYFDFKAAELDRQAVYNYLANTKADLVGHNVFFDSQWLLHFMGGREINWAFDTFGLYRQLATEGYNNLKFGLKNAQQDLLGWEFKGDVELDEWLCVNGYYKGARRQGHDEPGVLQQLYDAGGLSAEKGEMWRAPSSILGYYCGLDCASTLQLLTEVFIPTTESLPPAVGQAFWNYHEVFMNNVKALVEAKLDGFRVDTDKFDVYREWLAGELQTSRDAFFSNNDVSKFIVEFNKERLEQFERENQPAKYRKPPVLSAEPNKMTKSGTVSKSWLSWQERKLTIAEWENDSNISKSWLNWKEKRDHLAANGSFNIDSAAHRGYLFYDFLKYPAKTWTDSGKPAVDKKALKHFGEHGKLLRTYNDLSKESQMSFAASSAMLPDEPSRSYRIHPGYKAPGTFTGRLAGAGGLNVQQLPKRREYLECWIPDEGWEMVDADWSAIEMVVLTGLSRDPSMMELYASGKKNDPYLYNGSSIVGLKEKILAAGYDPANPTAEGIARAKKEAKKERGISKIITLGAGYGMGPKKLRATLALEDIEIGEEEAYAMYKSYWDLYSGVKKYGYVLEREWSRNNGWIRNLLGRPICCAEFLKKDLINRMVQSSAHDVHMLLIKELAETRRRGEGPAFRWLIPDFHDQAIVQVPKGQGPEMIAMFNEAAKRVNKMVRTITPSFNIEMKLDPQLVGDLADAKVPKE